MIALSMTVVGTTIAVIVLFLLAQELRVYRIRKKLDDSVVGTEKRNIQLIYLAKTAETLSSALSKNKLLRLIIEILGEITKSDSTPSLCALYLIDYNINRFVYETGYNLDVTMLSRASFGNDDHPFKTIRKNREIVFFGKDEDVKHIFFKETKLAMLQEVDHVILVPMIVENEVMGVVVSFLARSSFEFLRKDMSLLRVIAAQTSIALGSAVQSELAVLDRLTKIYNHAYFKKRLEQEVARSDRYKYPVSVLMIDIDHFKRINDTFGHQQGDVILKEVALIIKSNIRSVDLCARYGGEEFAVILPETDLTGFTNRATVEEEDKTQGALTKAEHLRKMIEKTDIATPEGPRIKLTISIGIGLKNFPEGARMGVEQLIREADMQLYRAKQEGRNRVCHS